MSSGWMNAVPPILVVALALQNAAHHKFKKPEYFDLSNLDNKATTLADGVVVLCIMFRTVLLFVEYA